MGLAQLAGLGAEVQKRAEQQHAWEEDKHQAVE
jgi:hypothetical protein